VDPKVDGMPRFARWGVWVRATLLASGAWLSVAAPAWARSEAEIGYSREQAFSAALRYLRVDLGYEVTEKDPDAAYLLFSFTDAELAGKSAHGSIEVVQRQRTVRLFVSLPELPSYREEILKRGLLDKLRTEYGEPSEAEPERPPPKKEPEPPKEPPEAAPGAPGA
jgi:hypothetical protein